MAGLQDIRAQHPEYNDMSDEKLADALYSKFYSDIPRADFDTKMGLKSQEPTAAQKPMGWGEVGLSAVKNFPSSTVETLKGMVQPVIHPIKTAESLYHTAAGEAEKLTGTGGKDTPYAEALNSYFKDRYGSVDGFKKALAKDPTGVMTDLSVVLSGGAMALPKLGATGAKVGNIVGKVAKATNIADRAVGGIATVAKLGGEGVARTLGVTAGTGARPIEEAYRAGLAGMTKAKAFLDNMKGKVPMEDVVQSARDAVDALKVERQAAYRSGIASSIGKGTTQVGPAQALNLAPIDAALQKTKTIGLNRTGTIETIPGAQQVHKAISDVIDQWRNNPALRTAEDFDEMKKAINNLQFHGELKTIAGPGTPGSIIVKEARDAISKEINAQAPDYAKVMKDYNEASDALDEITRSLSVGDRPTVDTALRKLQSVMRDNVSTGYGYRAKLAEELDKRAGGTIMPALAGQALHQWEPRGLARYLAGGEALAGILHPALLGTIPLSMPRVVGNLAYGTGAAGRYAKNLGLNRALAAGTAAAPLAYELDRPYSLNPQQ